MPRRPRVHVTNGFYHVTLRGNHRQPIFFAPRDRTLLNETVAAALTRCNARLHAYCWMTNHAHLLLQVSDIPLGELILRVAGQYARAVQASMQTTGHLFENRYHAVRVTADAQMLTLLQYIHLNPVRAGIVNDPDTYQWTSHHAYAGRRQEPWLTTDFLLDMLHPQPHHARAAYCIFMDMPPTDAGETNPVPPRTSCPAGAAPSNPRAGTSRGSEALADLLDQAVARFGVTREALLSPTRVRAVTRARQWIARTALDRGIASLSETARLLGRDESTLRKPLVRRSGH